MSQTETKWTREEKIYTTLFLMGISIAVFFLGLFLYLANQIAKKEAQLRPQRIIEFEKAFGITAESPWRFDDNSEENNLTTKIRMARVKARILASAEKIVLRNRELGDLKNNVDERTIFSYRIKKINEVKKEILDEVKEFDRLAHIANNFGCNESGYNPHSSNDTSLPFDLHFWETKVQFLQRSFWCS